LASGFSHCSGRDRRLGGHTRRRSDHGFTLYEFLIVVGVIGLLVAIAVPVLAQARTAACDASAKSDLKSAMRAIVMYINKNGTFPTSENDLATVDFNLSGGVSFSKFDVKTKKGFTSAHIHIEHIGSSNAWHANFPAEGSAIEFRKGKLGE
jgi:prepilin-type N-terminal cleavage/methylation domain-containing protein